VIRESVDEFLHRLASGSPVPGGGSAAALAGAASAGLVSMVCGVTTRHSSGSDGLAEVEREANELRARLVALMADDARAFEALLQARRTARDKQSPVVREALRGATGPPLDVARAAHRILELCAHIAASARPSTMADLGVAAALAGAALDGATLTVRVNLSGLEDPGFTAATASILDRLTAEASASRRRVAEVIGSRTGVPL